MAQRAFLRELRSPFSLGTARILVLAIVLFGLVGFIYLGQSSQATVTGTRVLELQQELEQLRRENAQLEYEIALLATPAKIAERARALGLRPATISQTMYVTVKEYPTTPSKPVSAMPESSAAPTSSGLSLVALWNRILTRLGLAPRGGAVEAPTFP